MLEGARMRRCRRCSVIFLVLAVVCYLPHAAGAVAATESSAPQQVVYVKDSPGDSLRIMSFAKDAPLGARVWIENRGAVEVSRYTLQGVRIGPRNDVLGGFSRTTEFTIPPFGFLTTTVPEGSLSAPGAALLLAVVADGNPGDRLIDSLPSNLEQGGYRRLSGSLELGPIDDPAGCCTACQQQATECGTNRRPSGWCSGSLCVQHYNCSYNTQWRDGQPYCSSVSCSVGCKDSAICCF